MMMETDPSSGQLLEELRIESKMIDFSCYNHHRRRTNLKHINWKRIITLIICMEALMDFGEEYGMQLLSTIQYNLPSSVQIWSIIRIYHRQGRENSWTQSIGVSFEWSPNTRWYVDKMDQRIGKRGRECYKALSNGRVDGWCIVG
jgi:hypothetical protein